MERVAAVNLPSFITEKQWCCLFDAASGRSLGRTDDPEALWMAATDGAILHPSDVIEALVEWGCLVQIGEGRWAATRRAPHAVRLPIVRRREGGS